MAAASRVKAVNGRETASDIGGNIRVLKTGDPVADHETIESSAGSSIHIAYDGNDILSGGADNDIFRFTRASLEDKTQGDIITDFQAGGADADLLDLSDLLRGIEAGDPLDRYLNLKVESVDGDRAVITLGFDQDGRDGDYRTIATIHMDGTPTGLAKDMTTQQILEQLQQVDNSIIPF